MVVSRPKRKSQLEQKKPFEKDLNQGTPFTLTSMRVTAASINPRLWRLKQGLERVTNVWLGDENALIMTMLMMNFMELR